MRETGDSTSHKILIRFTDKKNKIFLVIKQIFKLHLKMTPAAKIKELNFAKLQHININPCQINQVGKPAKGPKV